MLQYTAFMHACMPRSQEQAFHNMTGVPSLTSSTLFPAAAGPMTCLCWCRRPANSPLVGWGACGHSSTSGPGSHGLAAGGCAGAGGVQALVLGQLPGPHQPGCLLLLPQGGSFRLVAFEGVGDCMPADTHACSCKGWSSLKHPALPWTSAKVSCRTACLIDLSVPVPLN